MQGDVCAIEGTLQVPSDKSITHRLLILSALSEQTVRIKRPLRATDTASTVAALRLLGVPIQLNAQVAVVRGLGLRGFQSPAGPIDCGNAGTLMRLLSGVLSGQGVHAVLIGDASLSQREMRPLLQALQGVGLEIEGTKGHAPLSIHASITSDKDWHVHLNTASAQIKSALLLAALTAGKSLSLTGLKISRDHTERLLQRALPARVFHYDGQACYLKAVSRLDMPSEVTVPGDFSHAAFWITLALLSDKAHLRLTQVNLNPTRTGLLSIVAQYCHDASVLRIENTQDCDGEPIGDIVMMHHGVKLTADIDEWPPLSTWLDEFPCVVLLAAAAGGQSVFQRLAPLRQKESDRIQAMCHVLERLNVPYDASGDDLIVTGQRQWTRGQTFHHHGDHRIEMAGIIAGLRCEQPSVAAVSYPEFFQHYHLIGQQRL